MQVEHFKLYFMNSHHQRIAGQNIGREELFCYSSHWKGGEKGVQTRTMEQPLHRLTNQLPPSRMWRVCGDALGDLEMLLPAGGKLCA